MPPLTQSVANPRFALRFFSSCTSVVVMRTPVQPIGCPNAIAPPLTLSTVSIELKISITGDYLRRERFVQLDKIYVAEPEILPGKQRAHCWHWANAHDLRSDARNLVINDAGLGFDARLFQALLTQTNNAAAPSVMPDEFPAVTDPSFEKTGASLARS